MAIRNKNHEFNNNRLGFSIIEVVVALFIVGITLIIYASVSNSLLLNDNARHMEIAERIAVSEIEDLRATPFASLPPSGNFTSPLMGSLLNGTGNITISSINDNLVQIAVMVSWTEPTGHTSRSVGFTTLKSKTGM
jgi:prepilin-type N-terminal cleavage/methylation domain-containing protein